MPLNKTLLERFEHFVSIRQVQSEKPVHANGFLAFIPWTFQDVDTLLTRIRPNPALPYYNEKGDIC